MEVFDGIAVFLLVIFIAQGLVIIEAITPTNEWGKDMPRIPLAELPVVVFLMTIQIGCSVLIIVTYVIVLVLG